MALIGCPECHHSVSDQATACPNCAYPLKTNPVSLLAKVALYGIGAYVVFYVAIGVLISVGSVLR